MAATHLDVPFAVGGAGHTATTTDDDHVRDMIFEVLFTSPGERHVICYWNTRSYRASLQKWLETEIAVEGVQVEAIDSSIVVTVAYTRRASGDVRVEHFGVPA